MIRLQPAARCETALAPKLLAVENLSHALAGSIIHISMGNPLSHEGGLHFVRRAVRLVRPLFTLHHDYRKKNQNRLKSQWYLWTKRTKIYLSHNDVYEPPDVHSPCTPIYRHFRKGSICTLTPHSKKNADYQKKTVYKFLLYFMLSYYLICFWHVSQLISSRQNPVFWLELEPATGSMQDERSTNTPARLSWQLWFS